MRRLALVLVFAACHQSAPPPTAGSGSVAKGPIESGALEDQWILQFPNGADDTSPLVVAMHGMGDTNFNFSRAFAGFPGKAELLFPRGPLPSGDGFAWYPRSRDDDAQTTAIRAADATLWPAVMKHARGRPIIVTGFSQGAVMSYALAALHPTDIVHAFPVSGRLPAPLLPTTAAAPVTAFHGTADPVIPVDMDRETNAAFKTAGGSTEIREYPGVEHHMMDMAPDVFAQIAAALPSPK
ncbi:MAG TPA: dienelactone hydrolase family protein [Kofleriaceae bacterium]